MKIAIVCSYYSWPPSRGGVETIVKQVGMQLVSRGHEVHVVSSALNATTQKEVSALGVAEKDGVIIHTLSAGRLRISHAHSLKELKKTIAEIKPQIVHSHNLHPHLFQLMRWKSELKYKLVCEPHYPVANIESFLAKVAVPLTLKCLSIERQKVDVFIAHAKLEKNWLIRNNIEGSRIKTILFPFASPELLEYSKKNSPEKHGDLIYVGRVVPIKGIDILIKAMSLLKEDLPQVELTIVGPSKKTYLDYIRLLLYRADLQAKITITGVISDEEKYKLMKTHKALVLPSRGDFTPGVLIEGQAMGLPVIATKVGAVPEIVRNGQTGILVSPGNAEELARAIYYIFSNLDLRKNMSIQARDYSKEFLPEVVMSKLEQAYESIINDDLLK